MQRLEAMTLLPHRLGEHYFILSKIFKTRCYIYAAGYVISHLINSISEICGITILKSSILEVLLC